MSTKRVIALVIGCVMVLPAIGMLFGGGALAIAYATQRDDDGYFDATIDQLQTPTAAITGENLRFATDPGSPDWLIDTFDLDVRIRATALDSDRPVFLGIARQADLDRYLADVAHDRVTSIDNGAPVYRRQGQSVDPLAAPAEQDFWVAQASGPGTQELTWSATSGRWAAVVMNADGSPGVSVTMTVGGKSDVILPLALVLTGVGAVLTAAAVALIIYGASGARRPEGTVVTSSASAGGTSLPPPRSEGAGHTSTGASR